LFDKQNVIVIKSKVDKIFWFSNKNIKYTIPKSIRQNINICFYYKSNFTLNL